MLKYFIIYIIIETLLSVNVAREVGAIYTIIEIFGTAFLGFFLISIYKLNIFEDLKSLRSREELNEKGVIYLYRMVGIILLILPGLFTDIIGLLMQFSKVGMLINIKMFGKKNNYWYNNATNIDDEEIIDVDTVEDLKEIDSDKKI